MAEDEFEARNMRDGTTIVHRDKKVSRGMAALLAVPGLLNWAIAIFIAIVNGSSQKPVPPEMLPVVIGALVASGFMFMGLGLMFGVVRTIVTEQEVNVKFGLWGPRIPLAAIRSAAVVDYHWTEFGGWGIRRGRDGTWAYVPGGKRVLELRYTAGGKEKRVLVGCENPDETARKIEQARQPVRVATDAPARESVEAEAEEIADKKLSKG